MGLLGNILSTAVNIVNIPAEIVDSVMEEDNCIASPLREVSKIVKKVDD